MAINATWREVCSYQRTVAILYVSSSATEISCECGRSITDEPGSSLGGVVCIV